MGLGAKIQDDYKTGLKSEKLFKEIAISYGFEILDVYNYYDFVERWEVLLKKDGKKARVQVKGLKDAHKFGYTWLELTKDDGTYGWLYGKADVLAIRLSDRFNIYRMCSLRKLVDEKVDNTRPILKAKPKKENDKIDYEYMKFRKYNGFGRRDDTTVIVSLEDIEHCKLFTMMYKLETYDYEKY